jgi:protease YdgD
MRVCVRSVALLLFLCVGVPALAESLRDGLTRVEQAHWLAVGRLTVTGQGFCTATLVAPDLVLTAAHCLVNRRTGRTVPPEDVHFLAGYRTGAYAAHGRGAKLALLDGFNRAKMTLSRDLGLVRLSQPMPALVQPMPVRGDVPPGLSMDVLSYSIDRSQLPSLQGACHVLRRSGPVLYTSCEGVPGVSGAPLIVAGAAGPELAAVASSVSARHKRPLPRGNIIAVAADPDLTGGLLETLGLGPEALQPDR